jgi:hypothetical protein
MEFLLTNGIELHAKTNGAELTIFPGDNRTTGFDRLCGFLSETRRCVRSGLFSKLNYKSRGLPTLSGKTRVVALIGPAQDTYNHKLWVVPTGAETPQFPILSWTMGSEFKKSKLFYTSLVEGN